MYSVLWNDFDLSAKIEILRFAWRTAAYETVNMYVDSLSNVTNETFNAIAKTEHFLPNQLVVAQRQTTHYFVTPVT